MSKRPYDLSALTSDAFDALLAGERPVVILIPVGCLEPHGPHLALAADTVISRSAALRAAPLLEKRGFAPLIAPNVGYGVTRCASRFKGAISVSAESLRLFLRGIIEGLLGDGVTHVCLVNNHLEPEHTDVVYSAAQGYAPGRASVACPVERRWARTLSDEFKSGACHAGCYETSIVLAVEPELVDDEKRASLTPVDVSLSDRLRAGVSDFVEMGLTDAYAGSPADATASHGADQLDRLAAMIDTIIAEAVQDS